MVDRREPRKLTKDEIIERNMKLAFELLIETVDDPDKFGVIPDGASVFNLPESDPELLAYNEQMANDVRLRGETVFIRRIPVNPPSDHQPSAVQNKSQ